MIFTRAHLMSQLRVANAHLSAHSKALATATDLTIPFYRGEDCRDNHKRHALIAVAHWQSKIDSIHKQLNELSE